MDASAGIGACLVGLFIIALIVFPIVVTRWVMKRARTMLQPDDRTRRRF